MEKLPGTVLTRSISFIHFVTFVLYLCTYILENTLASNPWSHAG